MVNLVRIAKIDPRHLRLRESRLDANDRRRVRLGVARRLACEHEHRLDVREELRAQVLHLRDVAQVVVAIRQREASLDDHADDARCVFL